MRETHQRRLKKRTSIWKCFFEALSILCLIGGVIALLVPTIGGPRRPRPVSQMGLEIGQLSQALEAFRLEHGDYPPDFSGDDKDDQAEIELMLKQLRKAWKDHQTDR